MARGRFREMSPQRIVRFKDFSCALLAEPVRSPEIEKITTLLEPPSMHEVPIKRMSKLRPLLL